MTTKGRPGPGELHTFQIAEESRHHVIQAIELQAEQMLIDSGGRREERLEMRDLKRMGTAAGQGCFIVWPPHTQSAYVTPVGQEDGMTIFSLRSCRGLRRSYT